MAVFLSVSFPSFSLWNLSISHLSIILFPLILHSSHPLSFRQQPSRLSRQCVMGFFFFFWRGWGLFLDGWGLTGSYGSFRSSHLRSPSRMPEEGGWCKPREQIFDRTTNAHTCTRTLTHSRRLVSDSSLFTPVGPSAWICICNNRQCLSSCLWLGRHNGRWNKKLQITVGLSATS